MTSTGQDAARAVLRGRVLAALAAGDGPTSARLGGLLARSPPHDPDDDALAGIALLLAGCAAAARVPLRRSLAADPLNLMAAKALVRAGPDAGEGTGDAEPTARALAWHADADPEVPDILRSLCGPAWGVPAVAYALAGHVQGHVAPAPGRPPPTRAIVTLRGLAVAEGMIGPPDGDGVRAFGVEVPPDLRGTPLAVWIDDGRAVVGGPPPETLRAPRLVGAVEVRAGRTWVRALDMACPDRPIGIDLPQGQGRKPRRVIIRPVPAPDAEEERLSALSWLDVGPADDPKPDAWALGMRFALTGEPVPGPPTWPPNRPPNRPTVRPVAIVVPVHGGVRETEACLASLWESNIGDAPVLIVDDAAPDPGIRAVLARIAGRRGARVVRNPGNLGFVRSANLGMAAFPDHDVVLLNADTLVHGDWLHRLRRAALSAPEVATATPLSNDATILSYPAANAPTPLGAVDVAAMDRAAARALAGRTADIPTGVGFCLYVRRDALRAVGCFDAAAFDLGYGEENDFCLRASKAGWCHVAALDVYVGHVGSVSFGAARAGRVRAALRVLEDRHPGYGATVAAFIAADPLRDARARLDLELARGGGTRPHLVVCAELGGGTERYVDETVAKLGPDRCVLLRPEPGSPAGRVRLRFPDRPALANAVYCQAADLERLAADLRLLGVERMHLHHLTHLSEGLAALLADRFPFVAHLHDYHWICPRINLIDGSGAYCGEPPVDRCETCIRAHGHAFRPGLSAAAWRSFATGLLERAEGVVCSSRDAAARIGRHARCRTILRPPEALPPPAGPPGHRDGRPFGVAVVGAIGDAKGYGVLLDYARRAAARGDSLRFHVIGHTRDDEALIATGAAEVTGRYAEGEAADLLAAAKCRVGFVPSVWPETWCYAMTPLLAAGLPLLTFDLGAQAERARTAGVHEVLPPTADPDAVLDALLRLADSAGG